MVEVTAENADRVQYLVDRTSLTKAQVDWIVGCTDFSDKEIDTILAISAAMGIDAFEIIRLIWTASKPSEWFKLDPNEFDLKRMMDPRDSDPINNEDFSKRSYVTDLELANMSQRKVEEVLSLPGWEYNMKSRTYFREIAQ